MKEMEMFVMVFLSSLIIITTADNASAQNQSIITADNASAQNQSIKAIQPQDYSKQFAEFSQLLIVPNTLAPGETYTVYGQVINFLTGEGIDGSPISFRIYPTVIGLSTPVNKTITDPNGNFKIQFIAPDNPSFYYLSAYLTGNKNYYPTDSEPLPFVVFK
jgi:hypothetical protein